MSDAEETYSYVFLVALLVVCGLVISIFNFEGVGFSNGLTGFAVLNVNSIANVSVQQNLSYEVVGSVVDSAKEDISDADAFFALSRSKEIIDELQRQGFSTAYVRDLYLESKSAFDGKNVSKILLDIGKIQNASMREENLFFYFGVKNFSKGFNLSSFKIGTNYSEVLYNLGLIELRKNETYKIADALKLLDFVVSHLNGTMYNFTPVYDRLSLAKTKFDDEQFDGLFELINNTYPVVDEIVLESNRFRVLYKESKRTVLNFFVDNYKFLIVFFIVLLIVGFICYNEWSIRHFVKLINNGEVERNLIVSLIKDAQSNYFVKSSLSKGMYDAKMKHFREKTLKLNAEIPVWKSLLVRKRKFRHYYVWERKYGN